MPEEISQKAAAKHLPWDKILTLKDYYKIALELSDNPNDVVSNERNHICKTNNLPQNINKKVVLDKIS